MVTQSKDGWTHDESPFHEGESAVQSRLGVRKKMEQIGRKVIRTYMPDQHREFYATLPYILVGAIDAEGQPWASILIGPPGFVASSAPTSLTISAAPSDGDPLENALVPNANIGLLGIEPPTRRRNRINGRILRRDGEAFHLEVAQSFGNCPKYIQARDWSPITEDEAPKISIPPIESDALQFDDVSLISRADTFFIASCNGARKGPSSGADVSHRGGKPGFVRIADERTLTVPDFVGNSFFNTIGNLVVEPRAGLLFPDFASGDLLFISATANIDWDGADVASFAGAQRLLRFHVCKTIRLKAALPMRWSEPEFSPFLQGTGSW